MQCAAPDHWLRMHTSNDTILLQLHSNVPKSEMQTADFGVTVTSLALQGIYVQHPTLSLMYLGACWVVSRSVWLCELSTTTAITPAKKSERNPASNHALSQGTSLTSP